MKIRANKQVILDGKTVNNWDEVKTAYRKRMQTYGPGYKALHYSSESVHNSTLAYASKIIHSVITPVDSVLDVGCGIGSLVPFMPPCDYTGIDLVHESVTEARRRYPDLAFECTNLTAISARFDWVVLIGFTGAIFNPEEMISKAWELARKGIIVDFNDAQKLTESEFNTYNLGACTQFFLDLNAKQIDLYPTRHIWNIFVVHKQSVWL